MDITDPTSPTVAEALTRTCDLCQARKGELCANPINPDLPLPGRVVHLGRLVDRRRPKADK